VSERTEQLVRVWESVMRQDPDWAAIAPDAIYVQHFGGHAGEYRGHDGLRTWLAEMAKVWSTTTGTVEDVVEDGDVLRATFHLRLDASDVEAVFSGRLQARLDDQDRLQRFEIWQDGAGW
jgi:ketosteroid isomerase-like protein